MRDAATQSAGRERAAPLVSSRTDRRHLHIDEQACAYIDAGMRSAALCAMSAARIWRADYATPSLFAAMPAQITPMLFSHDFRCRCYDCYHERRDIFAARFALLRYAIITLL